MWFLVGSLTKLEHFWRHDLLGIDYFVYRAGGAAALAGGDPWAATYNGWRFAAPPPTVLPYAALALLPPEIGLAVSMTVLLAAAVVVIRALNLSWYWILFPPLFESLIGQNPDVLVIALLVAGPGWGVLAPMFKVYGGVPLVLLWRWKEAALAVVLCLLSLPWLSLYLSQFGELTSVLARQANGGHSAWGTFLLVPTLAALALLGRERAAWLIVPAVWPSTQPHYACMGIPVLRESRLFAAIASIPIPGAIAVGCIWWAIVVRLRARRASARAGHEDRSLPVEMSG